MASRAAAVATPDERRDQALLRVDGLDVRYGPLQVLFDVSVSVGNGSRTALLGTNGAGKSTLLRAIAGLVRPSRGCVVLDGDDITAVPPDLRVRRGLTLVEGGRATFPSLTVLDNLRMGAYPDLGKAERVRAGVEQALDVFPDLRPRLAQRAGTLSGGEQQMVALGRAVVARPRLLLVDELSLGLAPVAVQAVAAGLQRLAEEGVTILLVEQSLNVAIALTSDAHFMEKGEIRFSGPTAELLERGDLVRSVFFDRR